VGSELHGRGINVRLIPLLVHRVSDSRLRALLISELVARAIKVASLLPLFPCSLLSLPFLLVQWDVRVAMRRRIVHERKAGTVQGGCRRCTLELTLRHTLCDTLRYALAGNAEAICTRARDRMLLLYPDCADLIQPSKWDREVLCHFSSLLILARIEAMLGVTFLRSPTREEDKNGGRGGGQGLDSDELFAEGHLRAMEMRIKQAYALPRIEADCYALFATCMKKDAGQAQQKKVGQHPHSSQSFSSWAFNHLPTRKRCLTTG